VAIRYIFNTAGDYVAFVSGSHLFSSSKEWLGFIPKGNEVYRYDGTFLGYLLEDDRIVRRRGEPIRPRLLQPLRPLQPLTPLRPLRRLRMPRLQYPYEDVFEASESSEGLTPGLSDLDFLEGSSLVAYDGTFLGLATLNHFEPISLSNQFGSYGSRYSSTSVLNPYGTYGSPYSSESPFNQYTSTPPRLIKDGRVLAYLTVNQYLTPRIEPQRFLAWLGQTSDAD
jgi:hypothetical protein